MNVPRPIGRGRDPANTQDRTGHPAGEDRVVGRACRGLKAVLPVFVLLFIAWWRLRYRSRTPVRSTAVVAYVLLLHDQLTLRHLFWLGAKPITTRNRGSSG